ncbi:MAG TPA: 2-oxoglutarate dehydrogenase E1 component [Candidatus Binatia bacterium]|nr:2-oxoglutarate dehydrogenase E1 component [Candidatus Binatia bacterium]
MNLPTNPANLPYVEELYASYIKDAASVPADWQAYFARLGKNGGATDGSPVAAPAEQDLYGSSLEARARVDHRPQLISTAQDRLRQMIQAYRLMGHRAAHLDPLNLRVEEVPELDRAFYRFTEADLDLLFPAESLHFDGPRPLRDILERLRNTYCRSIGVEFMHIHEASIREWLQQRMEASENRTNLSSEEQRRILSRLTEALLFEEFIRRKFIGAKSFSIEGSESLIPLLDVAIEKAADQDLQEIVLAMAHRGRLSVLANIIGKNPREIFREFEDPPEKNRQGGGDVKYHLGHSRDYQTRSGKKIHLSLCFNPSHLEFVNPVALGRMRAKQDRIADRERVRGTALLIHGDASFAGQGITQEALNLSQLDGYKIGGALHVIVNNQIGFTTAPQEYGSTPYATDAVKMLQIPIFHVNGDDPEAVVHVARLAMDFRREFRRDVVIDLYGYRRWGHNEGDEPSFTQPVLYQAIKKRKTVRELYLRELLQHDRVTAQDADRMATEFRQKLDTELSLARSEDFDYSNKPFRGIWKGYHGGPEPQDDELQTGAESKRLSALLDIQTRLPADFHPHPKLERGIEARRQMARGERPLDWSAAESLAFATLATENIRVRLTGQDTARGTFSQRHAVLRDYQNGQPYIPLNHLAPKQAPVAIHNSPLSEVGALAFEYGYSLDCPDGLVLWEAQFGDFSNVAQVIIDQFITSAEQKWHRLSGIVLLLPHGFEGMGPEHSSARLERFLQLGADDNIQVVYPTTPAQYFHCLRRQALRRWRKPLVVLTPKSLLRHPQAVSSLEQCSIGKFQRVIADDQQASARVQRVLLCSGKIYYDLHQKRQELKRADIAIVRVEQLYPLPEKALREALAPYPRETALYWVQEEPENMGAWCYLNLRFQGEFFGERPVSVICRARSASPATGSARVHKEEQEQLLARAIGGA